MKLKLILILNCGSSSVKFSILDPFNNKFYLNGSLENIGLKNSFFQCIEYNRKDKRYVSLETISYDASLKYIFDYILQDMNFLSKNIIGIGHRVVHGGDKFKKSVIITEKVLLEIDNFSIFAPLHNPLNILGIKNSLKKFPKLLNLNVAVFDTVFHQTMPKESFLYAIPYFFYKKYKIRRYGAHGINHFYVTKMCSTLLKKNVNTVNIISCHLGGGSSITAIVKGKSFDTSMGLTPLEGLVMGTRSGDLDPSILFFLHDVLKYSMSDIQEILIKKSGVLGINEFSSDFRILEKEYFKNVKIKLSIDIFCYRLIKYISSYFSILSKRCDALVFTGGIGSNSTFIREKIVTQLFFLGFKLNKNKNLNIKFGKIGFIHSDDSLPILVLPANEEKIISDETIKTLNFI